MTKIKNTDFKFDNDKLRWDLLPYKEIEDLVKIMTFGANKYEDNSWKKLENGKERYFAALMRHLIAWRNGELIDSESGMDHLSHALCNIVFIKYLERNEIN